MIRILAVDPGTLTGYVLMHVEITPDITVHTEIGGWGEDPQQLFLDKAFQMIQRDDYIHHVVVERFRFIPGGTRTAQYAHSEIQGAITWMAHHYHKELTLQNASDGKKYGTRERLAPFRGKGGVGYGGKGHALDALSHGLLFAETTWDGGPLGMESDRRREGRHPGPV